MENAYELILQYQPNYDWTIHKAREGCGGPTWPLKTSQDQGLDELLACHSNPTSNTARNAQPKTAMR